MVDVPLMHEKRTGHVNLMTKDDWLWRKLYEAAKSVQNGRKMSSVTDECLLQVTFFTIESLCQRYFRLHAHKTGRIPLYTMKST